MVHGRRGEISREQADTERNDEREYTRTSCPSGYVLSTFAQLAVFCKKKKKKKM